MSQKEVYELLSVKKLNLEEVINKYGEIERYEIDPNIVSKEKFTRDTGKRVKQGEVFLPFVMKSITNKTLDSDKLKGQYILLQFQLSINEPNLIEKPFLEFEKILSEHKNIQGIFISQSTKKESKDKIGNKSYHFEIVPNGRNFDKRYIIIDYPTMILIDKDGTLISYYTTYDMGKLKTDLKNLQ